MAWRRGPASRPCMLRGYWGEHPSVHGNSEDRLSAADHMIQFLERVSADYFTPGPRSQRIPRHQINRRFDESHRAVQKQYISTAGVQRAGADEGVDVAKSGVDRAGLLVGRHDVIIGAAA